MAVLLVIVYHLNRGLAPGGFVGVDIFFVISGFVVTGSVLASEVSPLRAMGAFWRRRILRILPALLLMTVASLIAAAMLSPPFPSQIYNSSFRTGIAAIFGLGNVYLYRGSLDYFRADASSNPFVHTWSLGVEEQFYFLYALLFIGLLGLLKQRRARLAAALVILLALGAASFAAFFLSAGPDPSGAYYLIPFRFWEIAAGGLLAYAAARHPEILRMGPRAAFALQLFGLGSIALAVWFLPSAAFPSSQIAVASAAAVLLIVSGNHPGFVGRILASRPLVRIGLISYSLYLWHYPILLYWRLNVGTQHWAESLPALVLIAFAGIASYRLVEVRIRHSKASFPRAILPILTVAILGTIGLAELFQQRPGMIYAGGPQMWRTDWLPATDFGYGSGSRIRHADCDLYNGAIVPARVPEACMSALPAKGAAPDRTLLVVGDSHAFADLGMSAFAAAQGSYRLAALSFGGCGPAATDANRSRSCRAYWQGMPALARNTLRAGDSMLISLFWPVGNRVEIDRGADAIDALARELSGTGTNLIVEAPLPTFSRPAYLCIPEWFRLNYEGCSVPRARLERRMAVAMSRLNELAARNSNLRIWDPFPLLCPGTACVPFDGRKPLFRDQNHLSYYGSRSLGPAFTQFLRSANQSPETRRGDGSAAPTHAFTAAQFVRSSDRPSIRRITETAVNAH